MWGPCEKIAIYLVAGTGMGLTVWSVDKTWCESARAHTTPLPVLVVTRPHPARSASNCFENSCVPIRYRDPHAWMLSGGSSSACASTGPVPPVIGCQHRQMSIPDFLELQIVGEDRGQRPSQYGSILIMIGPGSEETGLRYVAGPSPSLDPKPYPDSAYASPHSGTYPLSAIILRSICSSLRSAGVLKAYSSISVKRVSMTEQLVEAIQVAQDAVTRQADTVRSLKADVKGGKIAKVRDEVEGSMHIAIS